MVMLALPILDNNGKELEQIQLPEKIFGGRVNKDVIHQAVVMYQACLRQGTVSTKTISEVSGGGIKPFRQKGTGNARAGSSRSPLWVGGGVIFGPHPRDFSYSVPKKIKKTALRESLNAKFHAKRLRFVDEFKNKFMKTKEFVQILKNLNIEGKILALLDGCDESVVRVTRNIPRFNVMRSEDANAYDLMRNKTVLLTKTAFNKLLKRIE